MESYLSNFKNDSSGSKDVDDVCLCSIAYILVITRPKIFIFIPWERELISASTRIKKDL